MNTIDFLAAVERDLQLCHVPFDRRQLEEFCRSMAPPRLRGR
jgi:hypothetical protein